MRSARSLWHPPNERAGTPSDLSNVLEIQEFPEIEPFMAGMQDFPTVVAIEPIAAEMQEFSEVEVNAAPDVHDDNLDDIPEILLQPPNSGESQPADAEPEPEPLPTLTRFYTCPLDQVVEELDQLHHDGASFSRCPTSFVITLSSISGCRQVR